MIRATQDLLAFRERCVDLLRDTGGDSRECSDRMRLILRWWIDQTLHAMHGDEAALVGEVVRALKDCGITAETFIVASDVLDS